MTFYGQQAQYNMTSGDLTSKGRVKVVQVGKTMTGINLLYNSNTGLGKIEKDIVLVDKSGTKMTGNTLNFDSNSYAEIVGDLKVKTKDATLTAHSGKYILATEIVEIPGKIVILSKNGRATMNDGVYYAKDKRMKAKNFVGVSGDKKARGDEVNYFVPREVAQLDGNVVISNPTMKFVGTQAEYSFITEDLSTDEKYKIYYTNYVIDGRTMKGNMKKETIDGTKVNLVSSNGEKLYGDFMYGDLKDRQINLDGNVHA